jgi:hypothetical protein
MVKAPWQKKCKEINFFFQFWTFFNNKKFIKIDFTPLQKYFQFFIAGFGFNFNLRFNERTFT